MPTPTELIGIQVRPADGPTQSFEVSQIREALSVIAKGVSPMKVNLILREDDGGTRVISLRENVGSDLENRWYLTGDGRPFDPQSPGDYFDDDLEDLSTMQLFGGATPDK